MTFFHALVYVAAVYNLAFPPFSAASVGGLDDRWNKIMQPDVMPTQLAEFQSLLFLQTSSGSAAIVVGFDMKHYSRLKVLNSLVPHLPLQHRISHL